MTKDRADSFLGMIRRSQRGRLKIYLGYCAGVGKTYQMLQEGHRLRSEGIDVVIGLLETHGRMEVAKLGEGLETIPRHRLKYRGVAVEEMDVGAIISRKPQVALIDELAHTNIPGSANPKRYQDVQDILAEGIHVITTMNVQHLESLYNIVEKAVGVKVRERLPDSILSEADQIVDVDLTTEDLRKRLVEGRIYPRERVEAALTNFFTPENLERLRELTLRELASQIDLRRRETSEDETNVAPDQVMVCLSSRGPNNELLLRYASRLAGKLNRNWYAVYVQTPSEEATVIDAQSQRFISDALTLAKQLGAMVFTYKGEDIADTILRFAKEYRVGHIVVGRGNRKPPWKRLGKNGSIVGNLMKHAWGVTVIVFDTRKGEPAATTRLAEIPDGMERAEPTSEPAAAAPAQPALSSLLSPNRIVIWDRPVEKEEALRALAAAAGGDSGIADLEGLYGDIMKREAQGSTFFNEGVAFPHVRLPALAAPLVVLGLTKRGISDLETEKRIELVFLILSPAETPDTQVQALGLASRAAQNRQLLQRLGAAEVPEEAMTAIRDWEGG
ncbi:MAG: PTS sugar transporter subunit IIA [Candidatus Krumholzibacteria bacterium]|nr:PTS sugar transporter subunit IIA [Candidatus Krumholzibacteria bacterium]